MLLPDAHSLANMLPNWQSKSSFESTIDDLVAKFDPFEATPKVNPVSIDALEASWELAASRQAPSPQNATPNPSAFRDADGAGAEALADVMLDPKRIIGELGLHSGFLESDLATLKREFALRNHPDRVPAELRELATRRMMVANALIDDYAAKIRDNQRRSRRDQTR